MPSLMQQKSEINCEHWCCGILTATAAQRRLKQKRSPSSHGAVMQSVCVHHRTPQQAAAGHAKFDAAEIRDKL